jgi:hypothetical protein
MIVKISLAGSACRPARHPKVPRRFRFSNKGAGILMLLHAAIVATFRENLDTELTFDGPVNV